MKKNCKNSFFLSVFIFCLTAMHADAFLVNTGNAGDVANYLDQQSPAVGSDLYNVIEVLNGISGQAEQAAALDQLQPALFNDIALVEENISTRIRFSLSSHADQLFHQVVDCGFCKDTCGGWWLDVIGDWTDQKAGHDYLGYTSDSWMAVFGFDRSVGDYVNVGAFGNYAHTNIDWSRPNTDGHIDTFTAGLYSVGCFCNFEVDAALFGSYNGVEAQRSIVFYSSEDIDRLAEHCEHSWLYDAHFGVRYPICFCAFQMAPFVMLDCIDDYTSHYEETGADSIDLLVNRHRDTMIRGEEGLNFALIFSTCHYNFVPSVALSVIEEWRKAGRYMRAKMQGGDTGEFTARTLNPNRILFSPSAELMMLSKDNGFSLALGYDAEIARNYWDQNFLVNLSYAF